MSEETRSQGLLGQRGWWEPVVELLGQQALEREACYRTPLPGMRLNRRDGRREMMEAGAPAAEASPPSSDA